MQSSLFEKMMNEYLIIQCRKERAASAPHKNDCQHELMYNRLSEPSRNKVLAFTY
jgi:hypothetical protein